MLEHARTSCSPRSAPARRWANLLRRYWMPIAGESELGQEPGQAGAADGRGSRPLPRSRRDLRLGRPALSAPPRRSFVRLRRAMRVALQLPRLAASTRRGTTLEQPFEDIANPDARFRDKVRITVAYPVEAKAGLLWAYLGPAARAAGSELRAVPLEERLQADRDLAKSRATGSRSGELDRSGPLRVDASQLERSGSRARPARTRRGT